MSGHSRSELDSAVDRLCPYKVGPLEDNAGNIITQGFLMAEELNMHVIWLFLTKSLVRHIHLSQMIGYF